MFSYFFKRKPKPEMGTPDANDLVRQQLQLLGDDGLKTRHVLHYAYPQSGTDLGSRDTMAESLRARGYQIRDAASANGLVLEHDHAVSPAEFDPLTIELSTWFRERGWEYDGWECAVAK